jgi:germination protein M
MIKRLLLYILGFVAAVCAIVAIFVVIKNIKLAEGTVFYDMYYVDKSKNELVVEQRAVNLVDSDSIMFSTVVDAFASGPENSNTGLVLPPEFKIRERSYIGKRAYIDLEGSFNSLEASDRILCVGALVYTLTDMSFINEVYLTVDGQPYMTQEDGTALVMNRENLRNNPSIAAEKTQWQTVTLYFGSRDKNYLMSEQRSIQVKQSLSLEYQIVEQLINGPEKNMLTQLVPSSTKIKDIKTEEGICYVNLSDGFVKSGSGDAMELTIYSIVNSLTELDSVSKVQFLIEGEKIDEVNDVDFSKPFERDESKIK